MSGRKAFEYKIFPFSHTAASSPAAPSCHQAGLSVHNVTDEVTAFYNCTQAGVPVDSVASFEAPATAGQLSN